MKMLLSPHKMKEQYHHIGCIEPGKKQPVSYLKSVLLFIVLVLSSYFGSGFIPVYGASVPVIAAASSVKFPLEEISRQFSKDTGLSVKLSFGSSGNFTRQIIQGSPFELFISADEAYVTHLAAKSLTRDGGVIYAGGRLVLYSPKHSKLHPDTKLNNLSELLNTGSLKRFAIANPEHAPYGRAAQQALVTRGLWAKIQAHLVLGENVAQAAQFASSGATQGGIFSYSYALTPALQSLGNFVLLPEHLHQPLRARMVLLKGAGETAQAFYEYLQKPAASKIFSRYGFTVP